MIKENDFVVLRKKYKGIEKKSVGLVKKIIAVKAQVFFIGKNIVMDVDLINLKFLDVRKTGKPYRDKICNICYVLKKDYQNFDINQTDAKGRKTTRPTCTECRKNIDGVALKSSEKQRMIALKPEKLFICPICKKSSIPYITANLVIDHDHSTGKAREWICDSCNTGLGRFKDDIKLMQEAIKYLRKYAKNQNS